MKHFLTIAFLFCLTSVSGQRQKPKNLAGKFSGQSRRFHFGFSLGINQASFRFDNKANLFSYDSLLTINSKPQTGFNLAIVSSLHITNNWKLRFVPALSFQDRPMEYIYLKSDQTFEPLDYRVEATYVDFPLLFKWRTDRINNIAPYVIGGGQYSVNMQSDAGIDGDLNIIKTKRWGASYIVGTGIDFFLPYFKFGLELSLQNGISNIFIPSDKTYVFGAPEPPDNKSYSHPLNSLKNRTWLLSLTFEG